MTAVDRQIILRRMRYPIFLWAVIAGLNLLPDFVQFAMRIHNRELLRPVVDLAHQVQCSLLTLAGFQLSFKIAARHPVLSSTYRRWLQTTPWRSGLPLPLGPVTPTLSDALILAWLVALMAIYPRQFVVLPAIAFTVAYGLVAGFILPRVGQLTAGTIGWIGLAAMVRFGPDLAALSLIGMLVYGSARIGMQRSLATFPWGLDVQTLPPSKLGWVFERLGPREPKPKISVAAAIAIPLIVGWSTYCVVAQGNADHPLDSEALILFALAGTMLGLLRWVVYGGASPISVWGRIWTGRLIIPGYDIVLVGPALISVMAAGLPIALIASGCSPAVSLGGSTALILIALLNLPPTVRRWQLTGGYRVVATRPRVDQIK